MGLTQFDIIVLILLAISAAFGFFRGAAKEVAAFVALIAAAAIAIFGLPVYAPFVRRIIHPDWLGTAVALVCVFLVTYLILRLLLGALAQRVQDTDFLGALDRSVGLLIGLARGLLVLGAFNLMFNAATPPELRPRWMTASKTWPTAQNMGRLLNTLAPKGLDVAGRLKPAFDRVVHDAAHNALDDRLKSEGYDARQRQEIDDLVEKSR